MLPRRVLSGVATVVVIASGVVACSDDADDPDWSPLPPVEPAAVTLPEDRDPSAVAATLAQLDPCALLRAPAGKGTPLPRTYRPDADGPHRCTVATRGDYREVEASVGVPFGEQARFVQDRTVLGGHRAYVERIPGQRTCTVTLPASFTTGIQLTGRLADCTLTTAFATAVATALAERPLAGLRRPRGGPGGHTACGLLDAAVGPRGERRSLRQGNGDEGYDECGVWQSREGLVQAVSPEVRLRLENDPPPARRFAEGYDGRFFSLGGVQAYRYRLGGTGGCYVSWTAWRSDITSRWSSVLATVDARSCERATVVARRTMQAARTSPPASPVLDRVLYLPDEPDVPAAGACADLHAQASRSCAPHEDKEVPDDPVELLRRAEADPDVACSALQELVRSELDEELTAVTAMAEQPVQADDGGPPRVCVFVEPDHEVWLTVRASTQPMAFAPTTEVAGHEAYELESGAPQPLDRRQLTIAHGEPRDPGHLVLQLDVRPKRSVGWFQQSPVDRTPMRRFDALAEAAVDELL